MKPQWVVVANASRARFFHRAGPDAPLDPRGTLTHPDSRQPGHRLADDRPGREAVDGRPGGTVFEPREDPRHKERRHFAREVAEHLDRLMAGDARASLWLCASDPFRGELEAQLGDAVRDRLAVAASHDWTACDLAELAQRLHSLQARTEEPPG